MPDTPNIETFIRQLMSASEIIKTIIKFNSETASKRLNSLAIVQQFHEIYGASILPFPSITITCQIGGKTKLHFNMDLLPQSLNGVERLTMRLNPNEDMSSEKMEKYANIIRDFLGWKIDGKNIINQCVSAFKESEYKEEKEIREMFEQEIKDKRLDISAKSFGIEKVSIISNYNFYNKDTRRLLIIIIDEESPSFIADQKFGHSIFKYTLKNTQN